MRQKRPEFTLKLKSKTLSYGTKPLIMGILNITSDSFSDGGRFLDPDDAFKQAEKLVLEGADILDIGGESTRPGAEPVTAGTELERVIPVIKKIKARLRIPVSIDTYKPEVASAALAAGADMINDVFGLRKEGMAELAAEQGVPVVIMHMQGEPRNMQINPEYGDVVSDIKDFFLERLKAAGEAGIKKENIILDPGIGFGKTLAQNLELIRRLDELAGLDYPVLAGVSRKSFIGLTLDLPPDERLEGSLAAAVLAYEKGASILRVHDVLPTVRTLKMVTAILSMS